MVRYAASRRSARLMIRERRPRPIFVFFELRDSIGGKIDLAFMQEFSKFEMGLRSVLRFVKKNNFFDKLDNSVGVIFYRRYNPFDPIIFHGVRTYAKQLISRENSKRNGVQIGSYRGRIVREKAMQSRANKLQPNKLLELLSGKR
ncbi:hypothetical protein OUZ56_018928 [Daphnia magna]|uniref:Uncharacterized protein n=1 Tax=Daphnia magna TaxID=35525 RepID=A0ABQ9ZA82_9CRUS|nr:hypothetical protein OUZ56_018928 [Daphnia magna]